jgi:TetR/AcrR family transcriptional repressor of nem operon
MPLEKKYDRAEVLEKATFAFWAHGYDATSISDLVGQTGLNRGSLYTAFGGKRGLFVECLAHYDKRHRHDFLSAVSRELGPRDAILAVFEAASRSEPGQPAGCLMVNSALEVSPHDPEIREIVNRSLTQVEAFFRDKIVAAQADGSISRDLGAQSAAKVLLSLFLGLRVLVRSELDKAAVSAVINQARELLTAGIENLNQQGRIK